MKPKQETMRERIQKCYWHPISRHEGNRDTDVYRDCRVCDGRQSDCVFYFPKGSKLEVGVEK